MAGSRPQGQDASRLPMSVVPKAGVGRERLLGGKTQALVKSTRAKSRNAADAGTAAGAGLQPLPAQILPGLKCIEPTHRGMSTEPGYLKLACDVGDESQMLPPHGRSREEVE